MMLKKMTPKVFNHLMKDSLQRYLNDLYKNKDFIESTKDITPEELGDKMWKKMFPQGQETLDNYFWILQDANKNLKIGYLWLIFKPEEEILFIGDIFVDQEFRGTGYGTQCLELVEKMGKNQFAAKNLELHVFNHNLRAKKLYTKFGFETKREEATGSTMLKKITK